MDAANQTRVDRFSGLNNVDRPERLFPEPIGNFMAAYPLTQANNVEIDNTYELSSRAGFTSVVTGTAIHSLWSDGSVCLYADGSTFYWLNRDYTKLEIRTDLPKGRRISYASFNDRVYYTNEYQIGYVKNGIHHGVMVPGRTFKEPLPPGQFIEVFKTCLYVASGDILYVSDPLCDYFDIRTGYRRFNGRIRMLKAVDGGIYVSDDDGVHFCKGDANEDFQKECVYPIPAVPFTDVCLSGQFVDDRIKGDVAFWTSEDGICLGTPDGVVVNLTRKRYTFTEHGNGAAFIRESGNVRHYINVLF